MTAPTLDGLRVDPDESGRQLLALVGHSIQAHPRSQQKTLGPSEVGQSCERRIGYTLLETEPFNALADQPAWLPAIGTAMHDQLERWMQADNSRWPSEPDRWLTEVKLFCGMYDGRALTGSCDLYDTLDRIVWDWKVVGDTQLKKYRVHGPGQQYRTQAHLYGRGWTNRGQVVDHVGVVFLPRNQPSLDKAYIWHEPYDEQVALQGLERIERISKTVTALKTQALPVLPPSESYCHFCPFFAAGSPDLTTGCPGAPGTGKRGFAASQIDPSNPFG